jgi:hypothetical protein
LVKDVRERFRMHQPVFDGHVQQLIRDFAEQIVNDLTCAQIVSMHFGDTGPSRGRIIRQLAGRRIDPEREQPVKFGMESTLSEPIPCDQIPVEGFHVSQVEDDSMPLRDAAIVEGIRAHQLKETVRDTAGFTESLAKLGPRPHKFSQFTKSLRMVL